MNKNGELNALIVRSIGDIESALVQAYAIDRMLFQAVGEAIKQQLASVDWHVSRDEEERDIWFTRHAWLPSDTELPGAPYRIDLDGVGGLNGGEDETWLAQFLQVGPNQAGAAFFLTGNGLKGRRATALYRSQSDTLDTLLAAGFQREGASIFLPLRLNAEQLAQAFENGDLDEAMQPVRDALAVIVEAQPHLDQLVKAAQAAE